MPTFAPGAMAGPAPTSYLAPAGGFAPPTTAKQADEQLITQAFDDVRRSRLGAGVLSLMVQKGINIEVLSDAEFAQQGKGDAAGFYVPAQNAMYLRREALLDPAKRPDALLTFFHEAVHAVDDDQGRRAAFFASQDPTFAALGGEATPQGKAFGESVALQAKLALESRAWMMEGLFAREIGIQIPGRGPSSIAAQHGDVAGVYEAVWNALLQSKSYNPTGAQVPPVRI